MWSCSLMEAIFAAIVEDPSLANTLSTWVWRTCPSIYRAPSGAAARRTTKAPEPNVYPIVVGGMRWKNPDLIQIHSTAIAQYRSHVEDVCGRLKGVPWYAPKYSSMGCVLVLPVTSQAYIASMIGIVKSFDVLFPKRVVMNAEHSCSAVRMCCKHA